MVKKGHSQVLVILSFTDRLLYDSELANIINKITTPHLPEMLQDCKKVGDNKYSLDHVVLFLCIPIIIKETIFILSIFFTIHSVHWKDVWVDEMERCMSKNEYSSEKTLTSTQ